MSFPSGDRNCYDIDISSGSGKGKGGKYLLSADFYYGNYDGLNRAPEFDLYVGVNLWAVVRTTNNNTVFDLVMVARTETVSVCLVNTGKGTPYISTIELRPLSDALYPAATSNTSLTLQWRYNFASATKDIISGLNGGPDERELRVRVRGPDERELARIRTWAESAGPGA
ncbi:putative LRR receptor-like serine/threonine-protein kinase [Acorus calamus]|uniref:LRR receptor-like serine/threonine-protein kinase n=1 Tax=Acorus calamus TaxID=4465 RepID=A0AAV9CDU0_ACOCL|nr:putative LRR receptor-like serine/threonine-protein kinase [Acorus calamus]